MRTKKMVSLISIFALIGILVVFWEISQSQSEKNSQKNNSTEKYVKVDDITKKSDLKGNYDNLDVSDVKINIPQSIVSGEVEIPELFSKKDNKCKEFFELTEKTFGIDEELYKESKFSYDTYPIGPEITNDNLYAAIGCTGFATVDFGDGSYYDDKLLETINLNNYDDREYTLANGTAKISEFVSFADKFFKKYTELLNVDVKLETVSMYENEEFGKYMVIRYQQSIDGVNLSNVFSAHDEEVNKKISAWEFGEIYISGLDKRNIIKTIIQGKVKLNSSSKIQKVVDLNQAADILNKKLAEKRKYKVEDINIEYVLKYKGNKQNEGIEHSEYNHCEKVMKDVYHSFDYYSFEPYWTFYIDKTYQKEIVAYVNCRNGEVLFVNNQ